MDELIKYMISKIGYTLTAIIGGALPGSLLIFVWNRKLYMELDLLKLIILSFAIPGILYVCNIFVCLPIMSLYNEFKHDTEIFSVEFIFIIPAILTWIEIGYLVMSKILLPEYTIRDFVAKWGIIGIYFVISGGILDVFLLPILKKGLKYIKKIRSSK
ncbi:MULTISPECIES: hypothetical protein [Blautia]|jgi:hypothetical protein|nr:MULTISPECIES: hypothetical protein [Blautia]RHQ02008.1 hypothetical protein DW999_12715 [Ruminococcus sp. AM54-14NS]RHQ37337.1 hypothetical protein DWY50_07415 [Ruminococcus sp. AF25-28AC]RHU26892.1 hypothetical protein DXD85_08070 [Ruminococcus sp. TM09-4]DAQ72026.1 MAG TPA: hypothetical protein [Bacteriophage sp.]DAV69325.1 MAG TPA: hypothetical protein [Caudoviricetes sp.]